MGTGYDDPTDPRGVALSHEGVLAAVLLDGATTSSYSATPPEPGSDERYAGAEPVLGWVAESACGCRGPEYLAVLHPLAGRCAGRLPRCHGCPFRVVRWEADARAYGEQTHEGCPVGSPPVSTHSHRLRAPARAGPVEEFHVRGPEALAEKARPHCRAPELSPCAEGRSSRAAAGPVCASGRRAE